MKMRSFDKEKYDYYVDEYIRKSEENGIPISYNKLRLPQFNLPDARWYVDNCPDENIKSWSDFVNWCGFHTRGVKLPKEKAINLIYKMQEEIDRPLMYDDFRGKGCYKVPIEYIRKTWGTINKMKEELGLEIIQESMIDRQPSSKEELDNMIIDICNFVHNENRNFITTREINSNSDWVSANSLQKASKKFYNLKLQDLLGKYGVSLGKQGQGINFDFSDGEHVTSQFEYMFSKYLKDYGLKYNVDYFRDVKYSTFIPEYKNNMNCDYVIHINGKIIYVEIAGIIEAYKEWYYKNKPITNSNRKEKYRQKLTEKEEMLKSHNLIYFILFPCDLTKDNFKNILENGSLELKKNIEKFMKNNIDWVKIRELGELKYSDDIKWGRNVINYEEAV